MTIMDPQKKATVETAETDESNREENSSDEERTSPDDEVDSDSNDSHHTDHQDSTRAGNEGWADSIAKILKSNKPKGKKTLVLSRAKKLNDVRTTFKPPKPVGFEVASEDGQVKQIASENESEQKPEPEEPLHKRQKRELPNLRVKPNVLEKDRERTLAKIATKGVVQLFNAVRGQQKNIDAKLKEAGALDTKREKVLKNIDKRAFLDVLMGEKSVSAPPSKAGDENKKQTWSVLREDFMMGAKLKDWDKELEQGEEEGEDETNVEIE